MMVFILLYNLMLNSKFQLYNLFFFFFFDKELKCVTMYSGSMPQRLIIMCMGFLNCFHFHP